MQKAYQLLEDTLVDDYVVGNSLTIADFSCVSSVSSIMGVIPMDKAKFPKIYGWLDRLKALPYYEEANGSGAEQVAQFVLSQKEKNAQKAWFFMFIETYTETILKRFKEREKNQNHCC